MSWSQHYIDNFLTMGTPGTEECERNLSIIVDWCNWGGLPLKLPKVVGPATTIEFLGIILDTQRMEICLSEERVQQLTLLLEEWAEKRTCRKRDLLSLIGKLAHACKVVRVGRIFLRRMIILSTKAAKIDHWLHLTAHFRADLNCSQVIATTRGDLLIRCIRSVGIRSCLAGRMAAGPVVQAVARPADRSQGVGTNCAGMRRMRPTVEEPESIGTMRQHGSGACDYFTVQP